MSSLKNKLHHLISGQVPEYLRDTFPTFVDFITEYYKFLEENHEANALLLNSSSWTDIDVTIDLFVEQFKQQYSYDFPPDALIERRRLIKFISQYYEAKGTENAAELYFRMMYNDTATIKYPDDYTLKASAGVWKKKYTIKIDTDYTQISDDAYALLPTAETADNPFDVENHAIKLVYTRPKINDNGLENISIDLTALNVYNLTTNKDIYEIEVDIPQNLDITSLNDRLFVYPYRSVVWLVAKDAAGVEYTYGFLSEQLTDYKIIDGGNSFKKRDTFSVDYPETPEYPIPGQEINDGVVRVKNTHTTEGDVYFAEEYTRENLLTPNTAAEQYTTSSVIGIIESLRFLSTGYRFDLLGDYFAENYTTENTYTSYNKFKTFLTNPRNPGAPPAEVEFTVGYIYEHPGHWKDNSGFLSDVNHLQDNYYYQPYSYVVQTFNTPYDTWKSLYNQSAHPAGFKVFAELLVQHGVQFTPVTFESKQIYFENFDDKVKPIDGISIDLHKVILEYYTEYDPDYFAENYIDANSAHITENLSYSFNKATISETALISDSVNIKAPINPIDSVITSDSIDTLLSYDRSFSDSTIVEDSTIIVNTYNRAFSDTVNILDTIDVKKLFEVSESTNTTDSSQYTLNKGAINETIFNNDSSVKLIEKYISVVDEYSSQQYFAQNYVDSNSATITDSLSLSVQPVLTDTINSSSNTLFNVGKNLSDSIEIHDAVAIVYSGQISIDDELAAIDIKSINYNTTKSDTYNISDTTKVTSGKNPSDSTSLSETSLVNFGKNLSDSFSISDPIITKIIGKNITETVVKTDTLVTTFSKNLAEVIISLDAITNLQYGPGLTDGSSTTDSKTISLTRNVSETSSAIDTNNKNISKIVDSYSYTSENYFAQNYMDENGVTSEDSYSISYGSTKSDSISSTDSSSTSYGKTLSDVVHIQDTSSLNIDERNDAQSNLSESTNTSDSKVFSLSYVKADTSNISENKALAFNKGTISDSIASTESSIRSIGKNLAETISESESISVNYNKSLSETVSKSDNIAKNLSTTKSETVTTSDSLSSTLSIAPSFSDSVTNTESSTRALFKALSDNVITSDTLTKFINELNDAQSDLSITIHTSDTISSAYSTIKSDTTITSDSKALSFNKATITETSSLSDSNAKNISKVVADENYSEGSYFYENYADGNVIFVSDNSVNTYNLNKSETASIVETLQFTHSKNFTDVVHLSDASSLNIDERNDAQSALSETTSTTDSKVFSLSYVKADTSTISENKAVAFNKGTISDSIASSDSSLNNFGKTLTEIVSKADSSVNVVNKNLTDSVSKSDSLVNNINLSKSEILSISDDVAVSSTRDVRASDSAQATDDKTFSIGKNLADNVTSSDSLTKFVNELNDAQSDLSITIHTSDTLSTSYSLGKTDTTITSDSKSLAFTKGTITDAISASESISVKNISKALTDTISTSDSLTKFVNELNDAQSDLSITIHTSDVLANNYGSLKTENVSSSDLKSILFVPGTVADGNTLTSDTNAKNISKIVVDENYSSSGNYFSGDYINGNIAVTSDVYSIDFNLNTTESISSSDSFSKNYNKSLSDIVHSLDSSSLNIDERNDAQSSLAEFTNTLDSKTLNLSYVKTDITNNTDSKILSVSKNLSETQTTTESSTRSVSKNLSETVSKSDSSITNISKNITDSINKVDVYSIDFSKGTISDLVSKSDSSSINIGKATSDSIISSESITLKNISKTLSDNITTSDSLTKFVNELNDAQSDLSITIHTSDTLSTSYGLVKSDTSTTTDSKSLAFTKGTLTDTVSTADSPVRSYNPTKNEVVTSTESSVKTFNNTKSETVTSTESSVKTFNNTKSETVLVSSNDVAAISFTPATFTDTISKTDAVSKNISLVIDGQYNSENYFSESYVNDNIVVTGDSYSVVSNGYVASSYVTDGYATETRSG